MDEAQLLRFDNYFERGMEKTKAIYTLCADGMVSVKNLGVKNGVIITAAHLNPDILVVDEVLAIGDSEFPRKAVNKLKEINQQGVTILYVSHNMETMLSLCKTGILLENGTITHKGNIQDIVALYKSH